jgi:hypothetical protein
VSSNPVKGFSNRPRIVRQEGEDLAEGRSNIGVSWVRYKELWLKKIDLANFTLLGKE